MTVMFDYSNHAKTSRKNKMNRRSLIAAIAALFPARSAQATVAPAKSEGEFGDLQWGREFGVSDGKCGFIVLPLLKGAIVESLHLTHIFHGDRDYVLAYVTELEQQYVGKSAALLLFMGSREIAYQTDKAFVFH